MKVLDSSFLTDYENSEPQAAAFLEENADGEFIVPSTVYSGYLLGEANAAPDPDLPADRADIDWSQVWTVTTGTADLGVETVAELPVNAPHLNGVDATVAGVGLLVLSPVIAAIAAAIKLDSPGPVLYSQERTAAFGETFTVYKVRSMAPDAEAETGVTLSKEDKCGRDPRVTLIGRFLRKTQLDEIPQLWSILVGNMSAVGQCPGRPEVNSDIERGVRELCRRWFVARAYWIGADHRCARTQSAGETAVRRGVYPPAIALVRSENRGSTDLASSG